MKKTLSVASALIFLFACNDHNKQTTVTDTSTMVPASIPDTSIADHTRVARLYVPAEGDVIYTDRKLRVWKNNAYIDADQDITLDDGIVVNRNGEVNRNDQTIRLEEGETVNRSGNFFNKAGDKLEDIWNDTKRVVKKAGKAVEKAAEKTDEKVKEAVH